MKHSILTLALFILFCAKANAQAIKNDSVAVDSKTFSKVDVEAEYPGGIDGWRKFLIKNLNAQVPGNNGAPASMYTVMARFIVRKDGTLDSIKIESSEGYGMDEEVIRVITKSGKWIPAVQNGKPVNAYRRQPIIFMVESGDFDLTTATPYVFYIGTNNELSVTAYKVKLENIDVTISKGSIKQIAEGKYIVKVTQPGRVIIEVFNTKKNKSLGTASFEVKAKK